MRKFDVGQVTSRKTKQITCYFVSDASTDYEWESEEYPRAAEFPVSPSFNNELQQQRAIDYAKYLNKVEEAAQTAYEQIHLVDVLTR